MYFRILHLDRPFAEKAPFFLRKMKVCFKKIDQMVICGSEYQGRWLNDEEIFHRLHLLWETTAPSNPELPTCGNPTSRIASTGACSQETRLMLQHRGSTRVYTIHSCQYTFMALNTYNCKSKDPPSLTTHSLAQLYLFKPPLGKTLVIHNSK